MPVKRRRTTTGSPVTHMAVAARWPPDNRWRDLAAVGLEALRIRPPDYVRSVFGAPRDWLPPHRRCSEYNILNPWQSLTTARFLLDIGLPSSAATEPDWARALFPAFVNRRFWHPTGFFRQPDEYGGTYSFPDEHWFFINGIATNEDVAKLKSAYLAHLFHRPVTVIQNATNSLALDLFECVIGKGFTRRPDAADRLSMTEPAWRATAAILEALNADCTRRVVVIAHSQGTIIMANVLLAVSRALRRDTHKQWDAFTNQLMGSPDTQTRKILRDSIAHSLASLTGVGKGDTYERLSKLEIYTFANCADRMRHVYPSGKIPYMEHFANEMDLVARLGVLSPQRGIEGAKISIDGPVFERKGAWGHLLNEHYLAPIDDYLYPEERGLDGERNPFPAADSTRGTPRLYEYFHGKTPH